MRTLLILAPLCLAAQTLERPVRSVTDPGTVTTRQTITPAGVPTVFQGRVYGVAFGAALNDVWVLHASQVYRLDWKANRVLERVALNAGPGLQGILWDATGERVLVSAAGRPGGAVRLLGVVGGQAALVAEAPGTFLAGAPAVAPEPNARGERIAAVPLVRDNRLALIDLNSGRVVGAAPTGVAPFGAAIDRRGTVAWVTNWGGRLPSPNDLTAPTGLAANADRVVIDQRGIAATGTVTRVDLETRSATHTIVVELHPTALVWDQERERLYVANGNRDSISVIDTRQNRVTATWPIQPFARSVAGIAPTALAIARDGRTLYAACGGINAVAVIDTASGSVRGLIPTAWYPNAVALSADGQRLAVASMLGAGSGWRDTPSRRFVHANRGALAVIELPDEAQLASYTTAVAENSHMTPARLEPTAPRNAAPTAIPARAGEPSLIRHVVYIIKENRTYDQVFGDVAKGNGDPSLVMFGEDVTPNQHRLAEQFVLLDNFYATGGNSGDGHQWVTQANETAYCLWPGYLGRSYPFDGSDPIAYAQGGFLWDSVMARGKSVRVYGEYAPRLSGRMDRAALLERWRKNEDFTREWKTTSPIPSLDRVLARQFPSYNTSIPDVVRAQIFLADFRRWEQEGRMPDLTMIQLPSDHTEGTTPGRSTPKAMVADNDLAVGQIVEALSRSRFWKEMAIFIVEDDAQNGVDHVDGHRTVALAVSPYVRRGHLDSMFYSNQSMVKTIELILGLPTLSLFDLIANDMRASFHDTPDLTPYQAVEPKQSLFERNPAASALRGPARKAALASAKMRWEAPDAAPTNQLNRILWHHVKGWQTPYPPVRRAVFAPLAVDLEDDER